MIQHNIIKTFVLCFFFFMPCKLLAQNPEKHLIHLRADSIQYNFKKGVVFYEGHVHAIQDLTQLSANTMTVYYQQNKINKITAKGNPAYYLTQPSPKKDPLQAWADEIIYYPQKKKVALLGKVMVQQRTNQFSGPKLLYDMKNQRVISQASQQSKAQLVIEPMDSLNVSARP